MKIVIVRKDNIEGYTAAWIARRMLKQECEIVFFGEGDALPQTEKKDLLIFGISFPRHVVLKLVKQAISDHTEFRMFDNDFKAKQELAGIKEVKINMKQSAARMAWEHLRGEFRVKIGGKVDFHFSSAPWIVDYSEDPKLWKWPTLNPFFVKTAIENCYNRELDEWDALASRDLAVVFEQGKEFIKNKQTEKEISHGEEAAGAAIGESESAARGVHGQTSRRGKSGKKG